MMRPVPLEHRAVLRRLLPPERPGSQTGIQALRTAAYECFVDRWPEPKAAVILAPQDMVLAGDVSALDPAALLALGFHGFIETPSRFVALLKRTYGDLKIWPRVIGLLAGGPSPALDPNVIVRRLEPRDAPVACAIDPDCRWIWKYLGDATGMCASGLAWGAIVDGNVASIALPFTIGNRYEDVGVVTNSRYRGRGLSPACVAHLIDDVKGRGHLASWSTSPDNIPSLRVAEKMGFQKERDDVLYITGGEIPAPARPPAL